MSGGPKTNSRPILIISISPGKKINLGKLNSYNQKKKK